VAPNERKVRIEVGYGFEGTLTDAVSRLIIENSILPRFRAGDFAGGISRGVDDIIQAVSVDAEEWKARARQRPDEAPGIPDVLIFLFLMVIIFIILSSIAQRSRAQMQADPRGQRRGGGPIIVPLPGPWGSSDSWGGSGGGWGGGFSGGGGSFGGGGASGSW